MAFSKPTFYWELAGVALSVARMTFHVIALKKYVTKLEELGDFLSDSADADKAAYLSYRNADPAFYSYYMNQPKYSLCDSSVRRSKGKAWAEYRNNIRKSEIKIRGFTPMARAVVGSEYGKKAVGVSGIERAVTNINEETRVNDHVLFAWKAIVNAPVGVEQYSTASLRPGIDAYNKSIQYHGQAFNTAGLTLGNQLFGIFNRED